MVKTISIDALRVGMFLVEYGEGTFASPLVRINRPLTAPEEIALLVREGVGQVTVDPDRDTRPEGTGDQPPGLSRTPLAEELAVATRAYNRALALMRSLFENVRQGRDPDMTGIPDLARELTDSLSRNSQAALGLTVLKRHAHLSTHCVNAAVVAVAFGMHLGLRRTQLADLAQAGLLHDLGMARISERILGKNGRLSPAELTEVRRHPVESLRLVRGGQEFGAGMFRAVAEHHERFDGSGYPRALPYEQMAQESRILAIADMYAALIAERPYRSAVLPREALKRMYAMKDREFYSEDLAQFIRCMGIFPVGSFVRLTDGRYGVVAGVDSSRPLYPTVRVVFDHKMRPVMSEMIDLAQTADQGGPGVQDCLDPRTCRVEVSRLLI